MTAKTAGLRATYSGRPYAWRGVVKDGSRVVATCEHTHRNRDQGSMSWGPSARDCADKMLRERLS